MIIFMLCLQYIHMKKHSFESFIPYLLLLALIPIGMSLVRPFISGTNSYLYMNFNLFLGLLPLVFGALFIKEKYTALKTLWFFAWLFFLPNAPYMITDLIHIDDVGPSSIHWYDSIMLFSYAWVGMLSWIHSVSWVYKKVHMKLFIPMISLLSAFGLYLGRFVRFNSWDVLTEPFAILSTLAQRISDPLSSEHFLLYTTVFWVFLMVVYKTYAKLHLKEKKES